MSAIDLLFSLNYAQLSGALDFITANPTACYFLLNYAPRKFFRDLVEGFKAALAIFFLNYAYI